MSSTPGVRVWSILFVAGSWLVACGQPDSPGGLSRSGTLDGAAPSPSAAPPLGTEPPAPVPRSTPEPREVVNVPPPPAVLHSVTYASFDRANARRLDGSDNGDRMSERQRNSVQDLLRRSAADTTTWRTKNGLWEEIAQWPALDAAPGSTIPSASRSVSFAELRASRGCPFPLACTDRVVVRPTQGEAWTLCVYDSATGAPGALPMAPRPEGTLEGLDFASREYGLFRVVRLAGALDQCPVTPVNLVAEETLAVTVDATAIQNTGLTWHTRNAIRPDIRVSISIERSNERAVRPYLQETVGLPSLQRWFINSSRKLWIKRETLLRTSVAPVNNAFSDGGVLRRLGGRFAASIGDFQGVQVLLSQEFCRDLDDPVAVNHCAAN